MKPHHKIEDLVRLIRPEELPDLFLLKSKYFNSTGVPDAETLTPIFKSNFRNLNEEIEYWDRADGAEYKWTSTSAYGKLEYFKSFKVKVRRTITPKPISIDKLSNLFLISQSPFPKDNQFYAPEKVEFYCKMNYAVEGRRSSLDQNDVNNMAVSAYKDYRWSSDGINWNFFYEDEGILSKDYILNYI